MLWRNWQQAKCTTCFLFFPFHFREFRLSVAPSGNKTSKHVQNTVVIFHFTLEQCKENTVNCRHHFANTLLVHPSCASPRKPPFPLLEGCFVSWKQKAHGLICFLNFILALCLASLSLADASPELVSRFMEEILLGMQKGWRHELCRLWRQICGPCAVAVPSLTCDTHQ